MPELTQLRPFGVEVHLDLNLPFTLEVADGLRQAFRKHHLLVFRGQHIPRDRQEALTGLFGKLRADAGGLSFVSNRGGPATLGDSELLFHFDMDYAPEPYRVISLYAVQVEDGRTSTMFVNAVQLWDELPDSLRSRLDGARVRNTYSADYTRAGFSIPVPPGVPEGIYSLPRRHPETGETILSLSVPGTREVLDMPRSESDALLRETYAFLEHAEHVYEHFWHKGDLVVWDNLAVLHARGATGEAERTLQKVSIVPRTLSEQYPQFPNGFADLARLFSRAEGQAAAS